MEGLLPVLWSICIVILIGVSTALLQLIRSKKLDTGVEIVLATVVAMGLFLYYPPTQAAVLLGFGFNAYMLASHMVDPEKQKKRNQLLQQLQRTEFEEIKPIRDRKRIVVDGLVTILVCFGAGAFIVLAPSNYSPTKVLIGFVLISVAAEMIERIGRFYSSRFFWLPKEERLFIVSRFKPRAYSLHDLRELGSESSPDLLKLHPLFTILSFKLDYTSAFSEVIKLSFPGEHVYITPRDIERWKGIFAPFVQTDNIKETQDVWPLWHPLVLKRLFWKGYFAITVKGGALIQVCCYCCGI